MIVQFHPLPFRRAAGNRCTIGPEILTTSISRFHARFLQLLQLCCDLLYHTSFHFRNVQRFSLISQPFTIDLDSRAPFILPQSLHHDFRSATRCKQHGTNSWRPHQPAARLHLHSIQPHSTTPLHSAISSWQRSYPPRSFSYPPARNPTPSPTTGHPPHGRGPCAQHHHVC